MPQEIEEAAADVEGVRRGCVVAFGAEHPELGTEGLVVVAETRVTIRRARGRLASAVTERVAEAIDVPPDQVVLVPPGRRAQDLERQGAARGHPGAVPRRRARPAASAPRSPQKLRLAAAAAGETPAALVRRAGRGLYAAWLALALPLVVLPAWAAVALVPSRRLAFALGRFGARVGLRHHGLPARGRGPRAPAARRDRWCSPATTPPTPTSPP